MAVWATVTYTKIFQSCRFSLTSSSLLASLGHMGAGIVVEAIGGGCGKSGDSWAVSVGCRGRSGETADEVEREPLRVGACRGWLARNTPSDGTLGNRAAEIRRTQEISSIKGSESSIDHLDTALHKNGDGTGEIRTTCLTMEVIWNNTKNCMKH